MNIQRDIQRIKNSIGKHAYGSRINAKVPRIGSSAYRLQWTFGTFGRLSTTATGSQKRNHGRFILRQVDRLVAMVFRGECGQGRLRHFVPDLHREGQAQAGEIMTYFVDKFIEVAEKAVPVINDIEGLS